MQYRQGDVLIERIGEAEAADGKHPRQVVVARGELTGHAHRVLAVGATYVVGRMGGMLALPAGGRLTHDEHGEIALPPGAYRVRLQTEWTALEAMRRVRD